LHKRSLRWLLDTTFLRTEDGEGLTAELLPVIKPAAAAADGVARSIDVRYIHDFSVLLLLSISHRHHVEIG